MIDLTKIEQIETLTPELIKFENILLDIKNHIINDLGLICHYVKQINRESKSDIENRVFIDFKLYLEDYDCYHTLFHFKISPYGGDVYHCQVFNHVSKEIMNDGLYCNYFSQVTKLNNVDFLIKRAQGWCLFKKIK